MPNRPALVHLLAAVTQEVSNWDGINLKPHARGGTEFAFGQGEIGHLHLDGTLDVPFPLAVRDELIASGHARPHHWLPKSGWVSWEIGSAEDVPVALRLLRRSYEWRLQAKQAAAQRKQHVESVTGSRR